MVTFSAVPSESLGPVQKTYQVGYTHQRETDGFKNVNGPLLQQLRVARRWSQDFLDLTVLSIEAVVLYNSN